jgi:hypothetical protein
MNLPPPDLNAMEWSQPLPIIPDPVGSCLGLDCSTQCFFFFFFLANFRNLATQKKGGGWRIQQMNFWDFKKKKLAISWPKKNLEVAIFRQCIYMCCVWVVFRGTYFISYLLVGGVPHKFNFVFFLALNQFDWSIVKKKNWNHEASPQNKKFYGKIKWPPPQTTLWHSYIRWEGEDFGQNIWD